MTYEAFLLILLDGPKKAEKKGTGTREKMLSLSKWCFLRKSAKSYEEAKGKTLN